MILADFRGRVLVPVSTQLDLETRYLRLVPVFDTFSIFGIFPRYPMQQLSFGGRFRVSPRFMLTARGSSRIVEDARGEEIEPGGQVGARYIKARRMLMAIATIGDPDLIVADEPTSAPVTINRSLRSRIDPYRSRRKCSARRAVRSSPRTGATPRSQSDRSTPPRTPPTPPCRTSPWSSRRSCDPSSPSTSDPTSTTPRSRGPITTSCPTSPSTRAPPRRNARLSSSPTFETFPTFETWRSCTRGRLS